MKLHHVCVHKYYKQVYTGLTHYDYTMSSTPLSAIVIDDNAVSKCYQNRTTSKMKRCHPDSAMKIITSQHYNIKIRLVHCTN